MNGRLLLGSAQGALNDWEWVLSAPRCRAVPRICCRSFIVVARRKSEVRQTISTGIRIYGTKTV
jgi:hypothetical protein